MTWDRTGARVAALTRWAHDPDPSGNGRRGQAGLLGRFEREVDPDGQLDPADRQVRATRLLKAHMAELGRKSGTARKQRARGWPR